MKCRPTQIRPFSLMHVPPSLLLAGACPPLHTPLYGVLVYNGSWLSIDQPEWQENATVTLQCDRGYELTSDAGQSVGRSLEITCEGNDTWSDGPEQYSCLSECLSLSSFTDTSPLPHYLPYTLTPSSPSLPPTSLPPSLPPSLPSSFHRYYTLTV